MSKKKRKTELRREDVVTYADKLRYSKQVWDHEQSMGLGHAHFRLPIRKRGMGIEPLLAKRSAAAASCEQAGEGIGHHR
jgi:hypothetical protein